MIKKILLLAIVVIVVVIAAFSVVVAMQPSHYRVERSATMNAPAPVVFNQVNDFHKWDAWSPWAKLDPNMKTTHEGPPAGTGAVYSWVGNSDVGEGKMTIVESRPNELIRFNLEFYKPMADTCTSEFTFKPNGNQTAVTWSMAGKNGFVSKAMCLFLNMDKMVGGQFEKGLTALKSIAENAKQ